MKPTQAAKNAAKLALDPFETLTNQVAKPIGQDVLEQLGGFWDPKGIAHRPQTLAQEDLARAREKEKLDQRNNQDQEKSTESAKQITAAIQNEYRSQQTKVTQEDQSIQTEVTELKAEITKLAKTAGVDTKAHLQNSAKSGKIEIKFLAAIIRTLRIKAEEGKSASELVSQRSNAKRTTGMLAWVSGKQMKIHEQGTLTLQG